MGHTRKLDTWQRERVEADRQSLITREARERMRRQSARDQLALARAMQRLDDLPDPGDDADDASLHTLGMLK